MRGTHAVLGVAMTDTMKQSVGYVSLLGMDHKSWGWDITRNKLLHNNSLAVTYPKGSIDYIAPDRIRCILNMDTGVLGFETEGNYLGDAFTDLKGKQLHIAVSTVFGRAQIGIQYISGIDRPEPLALQKITKRAIRDTLHDVKQVSQLPLPRSLRAFLLNE
ncbi:hypothetical protein MJO57_09480 [Endozoicomonas sp. SCSIO W0465]|nr:hypothetical protein MJO57_09480 [Endozoicomonas sp. SCSIO W0465]